MAQNTPSDIVRQASTLSLVWSVLLIIFGILAVASPFFAAVAVSVVIAWLIVLAGVVYLMLHPVLGVASLTLLLASLFLIEGVLDIILFFQMRSLGGSGWVLVDGIVTLLLGLMIYLQWPSSSAWAIGTLVGVSMIISGVTRVMLWLAVRKAAAVIA